MTIYIATDHAGFALKNVLVSYIKDTFGYEVVDCGAQVFDPADDYPYFVKKVGAAVSEYPHDRKGIVIGGSGTGEAIVVNKYRGVRSAVYYGGNLDIVRLSREHNDANILSLGARFLDIDEAEEAVTLWLRTEFSGEERHVRRINTIE